MSFKILNGDCLELMKELPDNSIDVIFTDLPYGQTTCKWDCPIDLDLMWKEYMRIKKLHTPIFFTTTTKFGVNLIQSAPKKCYFRYDLVWVKSASAGFLSAKKMPLRKHELIYVFYEKLPFYDLSSHKHKFIKVVREETSTIYNNKGKSTTPITKHGVVGQTTGQPRYDPPLPVSVIKQEPEPEPEENYETCDKPNRKTIYGGLDIYEPKRRGEPRYEPPLPNSILEIKSERSKHPTQKPVDLIKWVLKYYSKEGDVVLDNCMGSGSTGVACLEMNRQFIGMELDKDIFKVAEERLS